MTDCIPKICFLNKKGHQLTDKYCYLPSLQTWNKQLRAAGYCRPCMKIQTLQQCQNSFTTFTFFLDSNITWPCNGILVPFGRILWVIIRNKRDIVDKKQFNFRNCWRNHRTVHALRQLSLILLIRWSIMTFTLILAVRLNIKSILSTRCVDAGCTMILVGNRFYFGVVLPFKKWPSFVHVQLRLLRLLICRRQGSLSNEKRSQMCKWSKRYVYGAITIITLQLYHI